jgi:hypothetical protein
MRERGREREKKKKASEENVQNFACMNIIEFSWRTLLGFRKYE